MPQKTERRSTIERRSGKERRSDLPSDSCDQQCHERQPVIQKTENNTKTITNRYRLIIHKAIDKMVKHDIESIKQASCNNVG